MPRGLIKRYPIQFLALRFPFAYPDPAPSLKEPESHHDPPLPVGRPDLPPCFGRPRSRRDFDPKLTRDRWLLGGEWDHDRTFAGTLPTAALIDKYVSDRPVFLRRYDGHMGIVNSRVLKLAGITADTADPPGGVIFRK